MCVWGRYQLYYGQLRNMECILDSEITQSLWAFECRVRGNKDFVVNGKALRKKELCRKKSEVSQWETPWVVGHWVFCLWDSSAVYLDGVGTWCPCLRWLTEHLTLAEGKSFCVFASQIAGIASFHLSDLQGWPTILSLMISSCAAV